MAKTRYVYRRSNPFSSGSVNQLAIKVTGAIGGLVAASAVPAAIVPSMSSGWGGVGMALVVGFGGAWLLQKMSPTFAEGFLIGGATQAASRAITIVTGKTIVSAGMGQYAPLNFTIPTPAYQQQAPAIAASATKTSGAKTVATAQPGMSGRPRVYSKWVS